MSSTHLFTVLKAILLLAQIIDFTASANVQFAQVSSAVEEEFEFESLPHLLTPEEGCGVSKVANTKIVGGSEAKPGEYPWLALIFYFAKMIVPDCGGSLISSRHVLTAAHCINPLLGFVRLGEHDITTTSDGKHLDVFVERALRHPNFAKGSMQESDIGVIYLKKAVNFNDRIRPICLPLSSELRNKNIVGQNPFIAGWGDVDEQGAPTNVLMHVQVPVIDNAQCKELYKMHRHVSELEFSHAEMCAGYLEGGKDACQGDSGGPLMLPILNGSFHTYQFGIISTGMGCGRENAPGVYINVSYFMDWIQDTIYQMG